MCQVSWKDVLIGLRPILNTLKNCVSELPGCAWKPGVNPETHYGAIARIATQVGVHKEAQRSWCKN